MIKNSSYFHILKVANTIYKETHLYPLQNLILCQIIIGINPTFAEPSIFNLYKAIVT